MIDMGLFLSVASLLLSTFVALKFVFESDCHTRYAIDVDDLDEHDD